MKNLKQIQKSNCRKTLLSFLLIIGFVLISTASIAALQTSYYVSPTGSDANPGTLALPFKTIEKAKLIVRNINTNMTDDINIYLRGGIYPLSSTLVFSANDSASNGFHINYQAYKCENPVLSGGVSVTGWTLFDAGKNIYKTNVGTSFYSRQLYVNGKRAIRARSTNASGWAESGDGYTCPAGIANWNNLTDVEVVSYKAWKCNRGQIASVSGTHATMNQPYWGDVHSQYNAPAVWIENAYELLDTEGEWYLNRITGDLYYKPLATENMATAEVILPKLELLVTGDRVKNIQFKGLTFSHATWMYPNTLAGFTCVQAEWIGFFSKTLVAKVMVGNMVFNYCEGLRFENNTFEHLGSSAIQFLKGCNNNVVYNNVFQDISGNGISVGSIYANPSATDAVKNNYIDNNLVRDVAVEYKGCVGIFAGYTEQTVISHNEIRNLPYTGISMGWGWSNSTLASKNCEISYNYIDSTMITLLDGGGIYTLSYSPGTKVHHNYINNFFNSSGALYPDEGSSSMNWNNNVVRHCYSKWLHMWTATIQNDTVQNNYYDNSQQRTSGTNCIVSNNTYVTGDNWPAAALDIINQSGRRNVPKTKQQVVSTNLALGKPSSCSTFYKNAPTSAASNGNDGVSSTNWASDATELSPWWQVDLQTATPIVRIELHSRKDNIDQATARTNFEIQGSNVSDFSIYDSLAAKTGTAFPAYVWSIDITKTKPYRYVRVQRLNDAGHMNFSEFRIFDAAPIVQTNDINVNKVCIDPDTIQLIKNDSYKMEATIYPSNATYKDVKWESSNSGIVSVDALGNIVGITAGTAVISATSKYSVYKDSCVIICKADQTDKLINLNSSNALWISTNANGQILINGNSNSETTIAVYNAVGQKLETKSFTNSTTVLNKKYSSGVYIVNFISNDGKTSTQKVVMN